MPMSPRLLRPRASGATHQEALDWASRVTANGGTVSTNTLAAVSTFCASIDRESGLRAAILRLNLFCGNSDASLNAVRTPLYRSGSPGGTAIGNAMDTNVNFAEADYAETGASGGLKGNGTTKYLDTGLQPASFASRSSVHLSTSGTSLETSGDVCAVGSFNSGEGAIYMLDIYAGYAAARAVRLSAFSQQGASFQFPIVTNPGTSESHVIGTRTASSTAALYRAGALAATSSFNTSPATSSRQFFVFALNNIGTPSAYTAGRLRMYSIGNGLTAAQALAFSNAVIAFNTTLGRA